MTPQQYRCLKFIDDYIKANSFSPTFEEMRVGLGYASKSRIFALVTNLQEHKYLYAPHSRKRSIEVLRMPNDPPGIPDAIAFLEAAGYTVLPPAIAA